MLGAGGEWAFTRLASATFDETIHPRSHARGEDAGDCMFNGVPIDVKTTDYQTGRLVVAPWRKGAGGDAVYALMVLVERKPPTFEFKGFADQATVEKFATDLGHGPTFAVPQSELLEFWQVDALCPQCDEHAVRACLDCGGR